MVESCRGGLPLLLLLSCASLLVPKILWRVVHTHACTQRSLYLSPVRLFPTARNCKVRCLPIPYRSLGLGPIDKFLPRCWPSYSSVCFHNRNSCYCRLDTTGIFTVDCSSEDHLHSILLIQSQFIFPSSLQRRPPHFTRSLDHSTHFPSRCRMMRVPPRARSPSWACR